MEPVLLDTGVIAAWLNSRDQYHAKCAAVGRELTRPMITCEAVIVECCFLLQSIPSAVEDLLTNLANGTFKIPFQLDRSAGEVRELMRKYRDTPADLADACLIQMASELGTGDIL